jgi:hypothetical protein
MTVTRVKTTAGWLDLNTTGPKGDKGDPGYYEFSYVASGSVAKDFTTGPATWSSIGVPTTTVIFNSPVGAFTRNADGSLTVRDAGLYDIEASIIATAAWATSVRMITALGTGSDPPTAADNIARADTQHVAGGYPSTTLAGSFYLLAGAKVWVSNLGMASAGSAACQHFSIVRMGAGPQGAKGDQGIIAAYAQPNDPGVVANGTIWIDTDQPIPAAIVNQVLQTYAMTAGYTKDRAMNPASTSLNEIANVLATLIDDLRAAGIISP